MTAEKITGLIKEVKPFRKIKLPTLGEAGILHLFPLLVILVGIILGIYLVLNPTIFSPKASLDSTRIEFVDNKGQIITSTSSQDVNVRLVYVPPTTSVISPTPPPSTTPASSACLPGCCGGSGVNVCGTCANGQSCTISNGACKSGLSCDPNSGVSPKTSASPSPAAASPSPSPSVSPVSCSQCIINNRPDLLPFYKQSGWDTSTSNYDNIVNNWCSNVSSQASSECSALKKGTCSTSCSKTSMDDRGLFSGIASLVGTVYAASSGGKECVYAEGGVCHLGNCLDGSQNCDLNSNCGYVPGYSSGKVVDCSYKPSPPPSASSPSPKSGGAQCVYTEGNTCHQGNCLDGTQNCGFNNNCGYVSGYSSGATVACPGPSSGTTQWGVNIDPRSTDKVPNADQTHFLNPAWIRYEYFPSVGIYYGLSGIRQLVIFDYQSVSKPYPVFRSSYDNDWKNYLSASGPFMSDLNSFLNTNPKVEAIEIWNEEDDTCGNPRGANAKSGYCPTVPADAYAIMIKEAAAAIKSKNPNVLVVVGGLDSGDPGYLQSVKNSGALSQVDAIGIHPYGKSLAGWNGNGALPFGDLNDLANSYKSVAGKPIWITETSLNTTDLNLQSEYLQRLGAVANSSSLPVVIWYAFTDKMNPTFGLVDTSGNYKPVAQVFRQLTVSNISTASYPTAFKIANSADGLSTAPEQTFDQNDKVVPWKLISGNGLKTVYAQFKVDGKWGDPVSNSIVFKIPPPPSTAPWSKYDLNGDGRVNWGDVLTCTSLVRGGSNPKVADFDGNGIVDARDCLIITKNFH